ncbi:MAG TPA: hypothetical protein DDW84_06125 [Phycisphaerales bacterium]|nr:MAG: hypothetical protein A2Y13_08410 [Planctomycetes bacterium GWC2_45_44]HBG78409.1 hypothetical protein [Phycisphaerales bacterium]HBR19692.1 hypothetical protein [Phycisphaerales bacterium]
MSSESLISVVIPAYNAAGFIRRTIDSILAQTYTDYEIVVVDDGSTDDTGEIVKSYGGKVRYIYQKNAGDGPARNTGISNAKGDWIAFIDHDDEWMPDKLQKQMDILNQNKNLRWCAGNFYRQFGNAKSLACDCNKLKKTLGSLAYFENILTAMAQKQGDFMTSTMVIHKEVFEKVGVFDSCWLRVADHDMWWRIAYSFPAIGYLQEPSAILHLDVQDSVGMGLRLQTKNGQNDRELMTKHLQLADKHNCADTFKPCAKQYLLRSLMAVIYYGFKKDARIMASQFRNLLGWQWLIITYLLTMLPLPVIHSLAYMRYKLGLERQMSRRWITPKKIGTRQA